MKKARGGRRPRREANAEPGAGIDTGEILAEYDFSRGERGRHAARYAEGTNVLVLDPDVAAVFPTGAAANAALRALAGIIEQLGAAKPRRRRSARRA